MKPSVGRRSNLLAGVSSANQRERSDDRIRRVGGRFRQCITADAVVVIAAAAAAAAADARGHFCEQGGDASSIDRLELAPCSATAHRPESRTGRARERQRFIIIYGRKEARESRLFDGEE